MFTNRFRTLFTALITAIAIITVMAIGSTAQQPPGCDPACTFDVGMHQGGIATSPDGQYLYIGERDGDCTVKKFRLSDHTEVCTSPSLGTLNIIDVGITPDGQYVFATNTGTGYSTTVLEAATCDVVCTIPGGVDPAAVDFTPDGATACIVSHWSGFLQLVDVQTCQEIDRIYGIGNGALDVVVTSDGAFAYASLRTSGPNTGPPYVLKIDLALSSIVDTIPANVAGLCLTPDGSELWAAGRAPYAYIISTSTDAVIDSVQISSVATDVARYVVVSADGQFAYITNYWEDELAVVSTLDRSWLGSLPTGVAPRFVAQSPDGLRIFIGNFASECITEYTSTSICAINYEPKCCPINGDIDWSGNSDPVDVQWLVNHVYKGEPLDYCPPE